MQTTNQGIHVWDSFAFTQSTVPRHISSAPKLYWFISHNVWQKPVVNRSTSRDSFILLERAQCVQQTNTIIAKVSVHELMMGWSLERTKPVHHQHTRAQTTKTTTVRSLGRDNQLADDYCISEWLKQASTFNSANKTKTKTKIVPTMIFAFSLHKKNENDQKNAAFPQRMLDFPKSITDQTSCECNVNPSL